jgi:hypothetical protein
MEVPRAGVLDVGHAWTLEARAPHARLGCELPRGSWESPVPRLASGTPFVLGFGTIRKAMAFAANRLLLG